jgi:adenine-specific DNA-methyltransferase
VLCELLLKYGFDLAILTETRTIEGRKVTVIGVGALILCLAGIDNVKML